MLIDKEFTNEELSEFDMEEQGISERRVHTYSEHALKMGLPIDRLFVNHPGFADALSGLDRVFQLATEVDMPHGLKLSGPPGSGKTSLLRYFQRSLPPSSLFSQGLGAVYVRVPKRPNMGYLVGALLRQYGYPVRRSSPDALEARINVLLEAIRQKGTRMIMFDEAHNLASLLNKPAMGGQGTSTTDFIRMLMDEARVGVVLAGSNLEDIRQLDDALQSRVVGEFQLVDFPYDKYWLGLLKRFVIQCDWFNLQILMARDIGLKLHECTCGNLRALKRLITEAVLVAAHKGAEAVEIGHLKLAYTMVYGGAAQKGNPFDVKPA
ncbi:TniB family NTP-binding protein [Polaromonas sp. YR568]|uniref:TniB family NTP-binding protein n=1 Tax=Polaromonas sp. YR568 TaxID=1855301 RepID=UPI00398BF8B8